MKSSACTVKYTFIVSLREGKLYPILNQNCLISIPYPGLNRLETINAPFTAAHTYADSLHMGVNPALCVFMHG